LAFLRRDITFAGKDPAEETAMTSLQIFAFYVLPFCIATGGSIYAYFVIRAIDRKYGKPPRD
jgi:hypothetical protein